MITKINYEEAENIQKHINQALQLDLLKITRKKNFADIMSGKVADKDVDTFFDKYNVSGSHKTPAAFLKKEYEILLKKAKGYADFVECSIENAFNRMYEDENFAKFLAKRPGRQTVHQNTAASWISSNIPFIEGFEILPNSGDNAMYVSKGLFISGADKKDQSLGKSVDFHWNYFFKGERMEFYAVHKYTHEAGGEQDNQYEDVKKHLKNARCCRNPNTFFFAILDGEYYSKPDTGIKSKEISKIDNLVEMYGAKQCTIVDTNSLPTKIIEVLTEWLGKNFGEEAMSEIDRLNELKAEYA